MYLKILSLVVGFAFAGDALTREQSYAMQRDGNVVPISSMTASGKSQQYCQANPMTLFAWTETAAEPSLSRAENAGAFALQFRVRLIAYCDPRPGNLSFTYGERPGDGGTATSGQDYAPFANQTATFLDVRQFDSNRDHPPSVFQISLIDDQQFEPTETLLLKFVTGRLDLQQGGGFDINIAGSLVPIITLSIIDNDQPNQPPVAMSGSTSTTGNTPVTVALLPLVADPEGDALTFAIATPPPASQGTVVLSGSNLVFTPVRGFEGTAPIGLTVRDAANPPVPFTVAVTVTGNPSNRPPTGMNGTAQSSGGAEVSVALAPLFTDPDGDLLTFAIATPATNGVARIMGTSALYRPNANFEGSDQFTVRATDTAGNSATAIITVAVDANLDPVQTQATLNGALATLPGNGSAVAQAAVAPVASACGIADPGTGAIATCLALVGAAAAPNNGAAVEDALENLAAEEVSAQSNVATSLMSQQKANVAARMASVRGGGSGFDVAGLSIFAGNSALSLGMMPQNLDAVGDNTGASDVRPSPWGVFVNGSIGGGSRDGSARETGFDFDNYGVTAGVDYRLNDRAFVGLALGYSASQVDLDEGSGELDTDGLGLTAYYSWFGDNGLYLDGSLAYFRNDYEQVRVIDLTAIGLNRDTALSETEASQFVATFGIGYEFARDGWLLTPEFRIEYAGTDIDGFEETGSNDSGFLLSFPEQSFQSLQYSGALQVARAFSTASGIVQPFVRLDWYYESDNDGFTLIPRLRSNPTQPFAAIVIDDPDRNFGSFSGGLSWVRPGGTQFYLSVFRTFAYDDLEQWVLRGGLRWEF